MMGVVLICDERETVITKLTVAFRIRVLLTTVLLYRYSAKQGMNSEVFQNFGVAEPFGRRGVCRGSVCGDWDHITQ